MEAAVVADLAVEDIALAVVADLVVVVDWVAVVAVDLAEAI